ncbi:MAG: hypothetical protein A2939_00150 [Parcubacteria group bacterium RIFCSPLOWO2_01_FULL_48_18]|nr:MAG: hypothetical protein A3J67_05895 [Parcubacteria group bacterium RIFCSPHIGHO2_02_FULL_48_10b]OHB22177.1 MAG: hypothetical protein A2939_00150 [Parcubacteria group bacterium RIFCSPLOWO2_01_FULL_48_18]
MKFFEKLKVRNKFLLGLASVSLFTIAAMAMYTAATARYQALYDLFFRIDAINYGISQEITGILGFFSGDERGLRRYTSGHEQISQIDQELRRGNYAHFRNIQRFIQEEQRMHILMFGEGLGFFNAIGSAEDENVEDSIRLRRLFSEEIEPSLLAIQNQTLLFKKQLLEAAKQFNRNIQLISLGIAAAIYALLYIFGLSITRFLIRPLIYLQGAARRIADGNLGERVAVHTEDEIGELGSAFNTMAQRLERHEHDLEEEIKKRTIELRQEKLKLDQVAYHMEIGAILLDGADSSVLFINRAGRQFLNLHDGVADALMAFQRQFPAIDLPSYLRRCALGENMEIHDVEAQEKVFDIFFQCVRDAGEEDSAILGNFIWIQDITESKRLERSKNDFMAIVSHEMRTPLSIIRGDAELLLALVKSTDQETYSRLEGIQENAKRLLSIIEDFLDAIRLEGRRLEMHKENYDLTQLIQEAVNDLQRVAAKKGLSLTFQRPFQSHYVFVDKNRSRQVLMNIISNAIQYTDRGSISVRVEKTNGFVKIYVEDTGIGIPSEQQRVLFKKFETPRRAFLYTKEYGSGLGLYIARLLTRMMGGDILLEKSSPGIGSTFSIAFPASSG